MKNAVRQHGSFCWNELMTSDVSSAKVFYAELLGWEMHDLQGPDSTTYTMVKVGQEEVGGIMGFPPDYKGATPIWQPYIEVDDVEKQMDRIERLGGKVLMPPQDIPGVGRFIVINDPQGAMLALISHYDK